MTIYTEDFAGAAADLTTPWVQIGQGTLRRNGSGVGYVATTVDDAWVVYNNTTGNDQYSQIVPQFTGPGDGSQYIYLFLRSSATPTSPYYDIRSYVFWSDGGSDTQIIDGGSGGAGVIKTDNTFTFSAGDTIKFEIVGTTLKVYKNGTLWSGLTVTDSALSSGKVGVGILGSGTTIDNWQGGDVSASATLEQYSYRWRNDDGSETTATWAAAQGSNP
jgi:hypothetical protein